MLVGIEGWFHGYIVSKCLKYVGHRVHWCKCRVTYHYIYIYIYIKQIQGTQSTSQIVLKTFERLSLLKENDLEDERESFEAA